MSQYYAKVFFPWECFIWETENLECLVLGKILFFFLTSSSIHTALIFFWRLTKLPSEIRVFEVFPCSWSTLPLIRLGFFRIRFSGAGSVWPPPPTLPFIFHSRRTYLISISKFLQLLSNLCKVCWKWKNADIVFY